MSPQYLSPGVYVEEVDKGSKPIEGVGTAVAGFIGFAGMGPVNKPTFIANWTQYTNLFGGFVPGAYLAHAVYGYFNNGGGSCYVLRLPAGGDETPAGPSAALPAKAAGSPTTRRARAKESGAAGEGIAVEVADAGDDKFNLTVRRGVTEEKYEGLSLSTARGAQNAVETVNKASKLVTLEEVKVAGAALAERAPAPGTYALRPAESQALTVKATSPDVYQGNVADRSGLGGFEAIDDITMIACPDLLAAFQAGAISREGVKAVQLAMIAHCENMKDRVAILDPLPDLNAQQIKDWRMTEAGYDSKYAALYYPWIQVANPNPGANGASMFIPPSGHMAGIWARNDTERGVHKAPANEVMRGVLGLQNPITKSEQDSLNPVGINCIRAFPGRGIRVWGARTLSSDPSWRYVNVRRLFNFVEESIMVGTQWVVFEPNDQALWQRVKRTIVGFLTRVWRDGALFGLTPEEAFYVKCDAENNPPETRDVGQLIVEIGIAPVKPAEFVIFRISQYSGGGGVEEAA
jgi:phage tail sheath protein FI